MQEQLSSLWTLPPGDANYSLRWALIKRSVSMACAGPYYRADWMTGSKIKHRESTFWQRRYWEHCIRDETDFARHVDYILVERTADWPFSTFHRDVRKGLFPSNWGIAHDDNATGVGEPL